MPKVFIVANDFGGVTNYLVDLGLVFRSWTSDRGKALRFDTRALARRSARECGKGARVETIDVTES